MSLAVKFGAGILELGSAVGIGYGAVNYFSQKNEGKSIKSLIDEKFEHILLDFTKGTTNKDEAIWREKWATYKSENSTRDADILGVKNWTKNTVNTSTEELKERCKELSNLVVYDKGVGHYESVTKYCGREAKAGDEAIKNNLTIIEEVTTKAWEQKTTKKDKLKNHLVKLSIEDGDLAKPQTLKEKCDKVKVKSKKSDGYTSFYEAYKFVCTSHPVPQ